MELDELKRKIQQQAAPVNAQDGGADLQRLLATAHREDERDLRLRRRTRVVFLIAGVFYTSLLALTVFAPPDDPSGDARWVLGIFGGIFLTIGYREDRRMRTILSADHTMPAVDFLGTFARRYKFDWPIETILVLFLAAGVAMGLVRGIERYILGSLIDGRWYIIAGLTAAWAFLGLVLTWLHWNRGKGVILREIRETHDRLAGPPSP